jgi:hypothetical protein
VRQVSVKRRGKTKGARKESRSLVNWNFARALLPPNTTSPRHLGGGPHRAASRRPPPEKSPQPLSLRLAFPPLLGDEAATERDGTRKRRGRLGLASEKKPSPRLRLGLPPMSGPRPAPAATQNPSAPPPRPPPPPPSAAPAPARAREEGELSSGADDDEVSSPRPSARTLSPPAGLGSSCFALSFRSRPPGHRLWLGPRVCGELPRCSCLPLTLRIVPVAWISAVEYAWLDCLAALLVCNSMDCGRMGAFFLAVALRSSKG